MVHGTGTAHKMIMILMGIVAIFVAGITIWNLIYFSRLLRDFDNLTGVPSKGELTGLLVANAFVLVAAIVIGVYFVWLFIKASRGMSGDELRATGVLDSRGAAEAGPGFFSRQRQRLADWQDKRTRARMSVLRPTGEEGIYVNRGGNEYKCAAYNPERQSVSQDTVPRRPPQPSPPMYMGDFASSPPVPGISESLGVINNPTFSDATSRLLPADNEYAQMASGVGLPEMDEEF